MDHFLELSAEEIAQMKERIIGECVYVYRSKLLDTLNQVFGTVLKTPSFSSDKKSSLSSTVTNVLSGLRPPNKQLHDFFQGVVALYNIKHSGLEKKLITLKNTLSASTKIRDLNITGRSYTSDELASKLDDDDLIILLLKKNLNEANTTKELLITKIEQYQEDSKKIVEKLSKHKSKIGVVMQVPEEELHKITTKLSHYHPVDFRKLAAMKTPTLAVRYAVESVRLLIDEDFQLKTSVQDNWKASQSRLMSHGMYNDLLTFNPLLVNNAKLKSLQRYTDNREFKPVKIRPESELAADLCQWTFAVVNVANVNKVLKTHRKGLNECTAQLTLKQEDLQRYREEEEKRNQRIEALDMEIKEMEEELIKIRRTMEYRQRSDKVLSALNQHHTRWKKMIKTTKTSFDNLLGNGIFEAGFRVLLASQVADSKMILIAKWKSLLLKNVVNYDDKSSLVNLLTNALLSESNFRSPWPIVLEPKKTAELLVYLERVFPSLNLQMVDMAELGNDWMAGELVDKGKNCINKVRISGKGVIFPYVYIIEQTLLSQDASVHRASHSDSTVILHNLSNSPPSLWYELLNREVDKDNQTVVFGDRPLRLGPRFRLIFVASFDVIADGKLDLQFLRVVQPVIVEGKLEVREGAFAAAIEDVEISGEEETLLKMLSEYTAIDILESHDLSDQVIRICNNLAIENDTEGRSAIETTGSGNSWRKFT